ncbi:MAG: OsmC family protein [Vicinamibacterales bacterium]
MLTLTDGSGLNVTIDGRPEVGGQLLGMAVAACFANTIISEATARGVWLRGLDVGAEIEWVDDPPRTRHVTVHVRVEADASEPSVMELVEHADRVSRVSNAIRLGVPVRVADLHVTAVSSDDRR